MTGRRVLISGAARGIGAATARALAARGDRVALVGLEPEQLAELAAELGPEHVWAEADVRDQSAVDAAVAVATEAFGGLDVVIANAGIADKSPVRTADPDTFARTVDINLVGVFRVVHAALPALVESRGYVLVVASVASFAPLPGAPAYSSSKAGVEALTSTLRLELKHLGVDVGSAHPSWIDTDMVREAEEEHPSFVRMRKGLPWPVRSTTSVDACAAAMVSAVERRARRLYVPRSIRLLRVLRGTPLLEVAQWRNAPGVVSAAEDEARAAASSPEGGPPGADSPSATDRT